MAKYENGKWSVPITLTEGEGYFENLCVVTLNGVDYALGLYTSVEVGEESVNDSKDLVWTKVTSVSDLRLTDAVYEPEGLAAGDAVTVTLNVINAGDHSVEAFNVYLDGELLSTQTVALAPGESMELTAEITCPETLTAYTISVRECDRIDYYPEDNEVEVSIGYPDVSVSLQWQQIGSRSTVYATVTNEGVGAASGKLTFLNEAGKVLGEKTIVDLPAGGAAIAMCHFDWSSTEASRVDVTAVMVCEGDDLYEFNNTDVINLTYTGYRKDATPDLVLPTALKEIGDEAFMGGAFASVRISNGATTIGSRAFADCADLEQIEIPATVETIADDAFEGTGGFVIYCPAGSAAEAYAAANGIVCITE